MHPEPFRGSVAIASGHVTRHQLRTRYVPLYREVYLSPDVTLTAAIRARAAWLSLDGRATLAGWSAAALHGSKWLGAGHPAEIVRTDRGHQRGMTVFSYDLRTDEVMRVQGMRVTTPARTAYDTGRTRSAAVAIPLLDALLRATCIRPDDVVAVAEAHPGSRCPPTDRDARIGGRRRRVAPTKPS